MVTPIPGLIRNFQDNQKRWTIPQIAEQKLDVLFIFERFLFLKNYSPAQVIPDYNQLIS
jgi:hypothetical protein